MTDQPKAVPHYYYPRPESIPMLCEIENGYVYDLSSVIRRVDEYPGTFVRLAPVVEAPRPDWSQAPEWAMWHTIDCGGTGFWHEGEPSHGVIDWGSGGNRWHGDTDYEIPLGVDWRQTLTARPVAQQRERAGKSEVNDD